MQRIIKTAKKSFIIYVSFFPIVCEHKFCNTIYVFCFRRFYFYFMINNL